MKRLALVAAMVVVTGCSSLPSGVNSILQSELQPVVEWAGAQAQLNGLNPSQKDIDEVVKYANDFMFAFPEYAPFLGGLLGQMTNLVADISNVQSSGYKCTSFLFDDARTRVMNGLSMNMPEGDYEAILDRLERMGCNMILLSVANERDGYPAPTTFYNGAWFGTVDQNKVDFMRQRIQKAKARGFHVQLWGPLDDSPSLARGTHAQMTQFYNDMVALFDDLADSYCVGLEIDEWGKSWWNIIHEPDVSRISEYVDILKATGKVTAVHFTSYKLIDLAHQCGADVFNAQFGWLTSEKSMQEKMAWLNGKAGTLGIVACEYNRDGDTDMARKLSTAAKASGALQTHTGVPTK